ncbi:MAG: hypothetical protein ABEH81_04020 [Halopenitus sp.]
MTGAGSANLAFGKTDGLFGTLVDADGDGNPEYYEPGQDPVIQDITLERALSRQRQPNNVWSSQSIAGNLEGAFTVEFTMDDGQQADVEDIVFNTTNPVTLTSGLAATSRWYVGLDYLSGTAERVLLGCAPIDYTIDYTQGGAIRVTIAFIYGDEEYNTSFTPSSVIEATGSPAQFHSFDLSVDATVQAKEQSASLQITNISQFQRGSQKRPVDVVTGAAEASLTLNAIFSETDQLELAYGGSTQTTTSAKMSDVSGSMTLSAGGAQVSDYQLAKVKPDSYNWADVVSSEDTTEDIQFHVNGEPAVTVA